jgi:hypothetical protein
MYAVEVERGLSEMEGEEGWRGCGWRVTSLRISGLVLLR